jgi:adenosylcobinamide-phosphate synthase
MPFHAPNAALLTGCALLLDRVLGEPRRWHPLAGFGRYAAWLEQRLNIRGGSRTHGLLASCLALAPFLTIAFLLWRQPGLRPWVDVAVLYFALGLQSLREHAERVAAPLNAGDLDEARARVGEIVSRDTLAMGPHDVARAGVESVLENGNDAVFGALFWFALLGAPGALLYRLANTLDAMWGYRSPRHLHFGWAAARLDDLLNFVPARLTALGYAVLGDARAALRCWRQQARAWSSPNAGPVMASGAGSLSVQLGGPAHYAGVIEQRPPLGTGRAPGAADIGRAVTLVDRTVWLWLLALAAAGVLFHA